MDQYSLLQNILLGLTLAAPIGPVNLEIIKRGLNSGFRQAFLTGVGAISADATYLTLIFFGLTAFLNIPLVKNILGIGGSIILIYLGIINTKEFFHTTKKDTCTPHRLFNSSFITGYFLAISSPLTIVWWTGVFGALLASQTAASSNISAFFSCLTILIGCFLWVLSLAVALHLSKKIINEKNTKLISFFAGLSLVGFGLYFLYCAIQAITAT